DSPPDPNAEFERRVVELSSALDPDREKLFRDLVNFYVKNFRDGEVPESDQARTALAQTINKDIGTELGVLPVDLADETKSIIDELHIGKGFLTDNPNPSQENVASKGDPVMMFNGQFVHESEDLQIHGAGIDFVFKRTYKNQINYNGPLGFNWDHS